MNESPADADDLVRFFRSLRGPALDAYRALAEADRAFGEDVAAERREHERKPEER